ncbi:MAG: restriction endonuclease subunit S [Planctomycetaceae bacterium]|nr:restriction endonuclease subunit S [Planctomycetaceae bacterium]
MPRSPWPIPASWKWLCIGEICRVVGGGTPDTKVPQNFSDTGFPWITPADLSGYRLKFVGRGERSLSERGRATSSVQELPAGAVLFSSRAPIGYVAIAENPLTTNQGFKSFVPPVGITPDYLYYFLKYARPLALELASGTTFPEVSAKRVAQLPLCIPPTNEQRRIVAKIDELFSDLDAGVAALQRAKAKLARYRAAVLKSAVEGRLTAGWRAAHPNTEPASDLLARILTERRRRWEEDQLARYAAANRQPPKGWREKYREPEGPDTENLPALPESWCWATMDQVMSYLRNGLPPKPSPEPPGFRILRINAVRPMSVDLDEVRFLDWPKQDVEPYLVNSGDLLFTRYNGSVDLLGVAGMVRECHEPTLHPDKLIRVQFVFPQMAAFMEIAANVGASRTHMVSRARTTAGQTGISGTDIRQMPVPLPPLDEQAAIVEAAEQVVSVIERSVAIVEPNLRRASRLRQSILRRAFEGRLVPQDPTDEPAEELLARIKSERKEQAATNGKVRKSRKART